MTLENLARIGRLRKHAPTPRELAKLLDAADRNLADARNRSISHRTAPAIHSQHKAFRRPEQDRRYHARQSRWPAPFRHSR